jgi:hypothetical protein
MLDHAGRTSAAISPMIPAMIALGPGGLVEIGLQLPREGFRAVKQASQGGFSMGLDAAPVVCVEREQPASSHGLCAGLRGPIPCARRQRSQRRRLRSRGVIMHLTM